MRLAPRLKWAGLALVILVAAAAAVLFSIDVGSYRGEIAAEFRKATGRELTIDGDIDLSISLSPTVVVERVSIANAGWSSRPAMVALERAEAEVELLALLTGDIRVSRLVLVEPDILLETNADGLSNWRAGPLSGDRPAAPARPAEADGQGKAGGGPLSVPIFNHVEIRRGRLTYRDARTGEDMRLDLERVSAQAESFGAPLEIRAAGAWNGHPFSVSGTVESLAGLAAGSSIGFDFEARLAASDLAGQVQLVLAGPRPRLSGTLESSVIDLAGLLQKSGGGRPAASGGGAKPEETRRDRVFPDDPLSLDGLRAADLDLALSIGKLAGRAVPVGEANARIRLDNGALTVRPFRASVAGSPVEGGFRLDARRATPRLRLEARADGFDLGRLLAEAGVTDVFEGKARARIDLSSAGRSVAALMAGLDGDIGIVGGSGRLNTQTFDTATSGASALLGTLFSGRRQWTVVNCAIASIGVEKGRATSRAALIDTEDSTLAASGVADLASETLDLVVEPRAKSATLNIAVPLRIRGSFAEPRIRPETGAVLKKLGGLAALALFPPAAIVGLGELGGGGNECLKTAAGPRSPSPEKAVRELGDNLKGTVKDIGRGLKGLFHRKKD